MADSPLLPESVDFNYRETINERIRQEKEDFLAALREIPIIQIAAAKAGVHRSLYYVWRKSDEDFARRADEAIGEGEAKISDLAESKMVTLINDGDKTMIIFWLKHHLQTYASKPSVIIEPSKNNQSQKIVISWQDETKDNVEKQL